MKKYPFLIASLLSISLLASCGGQPAPQKYTAIITSEDTSKGTVSGGGTYTYDETVTIKATPNTGYAFSGWYDGETLVSNQATYEFKMPEKNINYVGKFNFESYKVTVTSEDTSKGTVTGGGTYVYTSNVSVKAIPNTGHSFIGWYDGETLVSNQATYEFNMPAKDVNYVAKFSIQSYKVTVTSEDTSKGIVSGGGVFTYNTTVMIKATPSTGYTFIGWFEGEKIIANKEIYEFKMPAKDVNYVAKFGVDVYSVVLTSSPSDGGTVEGSGIYTYGETVTIKATPNIGYSFVGWYDGETLISYKATYEFKMPANNVWPEAEFSIELYTLTLTASPSDGGTLEGARSYTYDEPATIKATPNNGYTFEGWYDGETLISNQATYEFKMPANNLNYTAKFNAKVYALAVTSEDVTKGTVSGGGSYPYNTTVTIKATPNTGCSFAGWYDGGTFISSKETYEFKMPAKDTGYLAKFSLNLYSVTVTSEDTSKGTVTGGGSYPYNTTVTIKATPNTGYSFDGWYDGGTLVSNQATYEFRMPVNNLNYVAKFKINSYTVTLNADPSDGGTFEGAKSYTYGETVTIQASPNTGYAFSGWYDGKTLISSELTYQFKMPANNISYTGKFINANTWYIKDDWWNYCSNGKVGEQATKDDIGREVNLTVNGQVHKVRLIDVDHDELSTGNGKAHCTFDFTNLVSDANGYSLATFWNLQNGQDANNYNYPNSDIRKALDGLGNGTIRWYEKGASTKSNTYTKSVFEMLPSGLQSAIKTVKKYIATTSSYDVTSYDARVFGLTHAELTKSSSYECKVEGTTYKFYSDNDGDYAPVRRKHQVKWHDGQLYESTTVTDLDWEAWSQAGYNALTDSYGGWYYIATPHAGDINVGWMIEGNGEFSMVRKIFKSANAVAPGFCI